MLLAATSTALVNALHTSRTGSFRKAAKVPYPNAYASATEPRPTRRSTSSTARKRAHANFLENQPSFLVTLLISGLQYPVLSAIMGAVWSSGRVLYLYGYTQRRLQEAGGDTGGVNTWLRRR